MSRFIDRISAESGIPEGLSVEDLYAYSKSMMFDYIANNNNVIELKKTEKLAKKIVEIENNERAYSNYFFILTNSGQFDKVFRICKELLKDEKFEKFALTSLSDKVFVDKGFIDNEKRVQILNKRLEFSCCDEETAYILHLLKEL